MGKVGEKLQHPALFIPTGSRELESKILQRCRWRELARQRDSFKQLDPLKLMDLLFSFK